MFYLLATIDQPVGGLIDRPGRLGWINATHVCRCWRAILLRMPLVWGKVAGSFSSSLACTTIIERSGQTPLIFWPSDDIERQMLYGEYEGQGISVAASELALQYLYRVKALGWQLRPVSNSQGGIAPLGDKTLPFLHELSIYGSQPPNIVDIGTVRAPVLKIMYLRDVLSVTHAPLLRALHLHYTSDVKIPTSAIYALLADLPLLEELDLVGAINDESPHSTIITLPRLVSLQYSGRWAHFLALWSSIIIEPPAQLELELFDHVQDVFSPFRAHVCREEFDSVRMSYDSDDKEFDLQVFPSVSGSTFVTPSGRTIRSGVFVRFLDYRRGLGHNEVDPDLLVASLVGSVVPTNIRHVDFDLLFNTDNFVCEAGPLRNALLPLTDVDTVSAGRDTSFMHFFTLFVYMDGFRLQSPVFPKLRTLIFKDMLDTIPYMPASGHEATGLMLNNWIFLSTGLRNMSLLGCHLSRVVMTKYSKEELEGHAEMMEYQEMHVEGAEFASPYRGLHDRPPTKLEAIEPRPF